MINNDDILDLIKNTDEPICIIDIEMIYKQYLIWIKYLPYFIKPYYAVKCNPNEVILKYLATLNFNFDCASKIELETILKITNNPDRIIYANPCKNLSYIEYAKNNNISLMTFDSEEELIKIHNIYPNANLVLRIAVDDSHSLCKFNSKFGYDIKNIDKMIKKIKELNVKLEGISFHVGSNCKKSSVYFEAIKNCKMIYNKLLEHNIILKIIDIGGGFNSNEELFKDIAINITKGIEEYFKDIEIEFIAEPGRFMVETSHTLILSVIAKKKEDDVIKYYLNDGVYGSFNCIYYDHQEPIIKELRERNSKKYNSIFFGPTCDSMDVIYKNIEYPELEIGDYLYVENHGAYTISPATKFNGFAINNIKYIS